MAKVIAIHKKQPSPIEAYMDRLNKKMADRVFDQYKRNLKNEIKKSHDSNIR